MELTKESPRFYFLSANAEEWRRFKEILCSSEDSIDQLLTVCRSTVGETKGLERMLQEVQREEAQQVISGVIKLALKAEYLFPEHSVEIIGQGVQGECWLSSEQVGWIIAHGLLGIIPQQNLELDMPPVINFNNWVSWDEDVYIQKLIFNYQYFKALLQELDEGNKMLKFFI